MQYLFGKKKEPTKYQSETEQYLDDTAPNKFGR